MKSKEFKEKFNDAEKEILEEDKSAKEAEVDLEIVHEGRTIMSDITRITRNDNRIVLEAITNEEEKIRSIMDECLKEGDYSKKVRMDKNAGKRERAEATVRFHGASKKIAEIIVKRSGGSVSYKKALEITREGRAKIESAVFGEKEDADKAGKGKRETGIGRLEQILKMKEEKK